jgi:hypothetical protein
MKMAKEDKPRNRLPPMVSTIDVGNLNHRDQQAHRRGHAMFSLRHAVPPRRMAQRRESVLLQWMSHGF